MTGLLRTKLIVPQTSAEYVTRTRLTSDLTAGIDRRLTLVSAPAGYGKTTLLAQWATSLGDTVALCWLSIDEYDDDLSRFLIYLVAALQNVDDGVGESILANIHGGIPGDPQAAMTAIINDLAELAPDRKIVLVLDDYHFIDERRIHHALNFLLTHMPSTLHVAITTRSDPPLDLPRRRARGELTEIRSADLSFNHLETVTFFDKRLQDHLPDEDVALLETRTEGWAASLQLAALALQSPVNERHAFITSFAGSDRYIIDYLVDEVIRQQSADILQFLLDTAILERLSASLCDAVRQSVDSKTLLDRIENSNLFLFPLDNQRIWFRYHQLFADMLRFRLLEHNAESIPMLHERASKWYEQNDFIEEAVAHALSAGNETGVADLIARHAHQLFSDGKISTVWHWLEQLPFQLIAQRPALYLIYGLILWRFGRIDDLARHLRTAPAPADLSSPEQGELLMLEALLAFHAGDFEQTLALTKNASALLKDEAPTVRMPAISLQASCYEAQGNLDAAIDCQMGIAKMALASDSLTASLFSMGKLVVLYCRRKAWAKAALTYEEVMEIAHARNAMHIPLLGPAHIGMGLWRQHYDQEGPAVEAIGQGIALCKQWGGLHIDALRGYSALVGVLRSRSQEHDLQAIVNEANLFIEQNQLPEWITSEFYASLLPFQQLPDPLTPRELDILRRLDSDLTTSQIAGELIVGVSTVRTHIKRIYAKLSVHSRHEAVIRAKKLELI